MSDREGFTIEISSRYEGWWRYNAALMCGCFDAAGQRTDFASAASTVADVGANLRERPADLPADRRVTLSAPACDHLMLYVYVIPHTLPTDNDIDATRPFDLDLKITFAGRRLRTERYTINQWSGISLELRVDHP